MRVVCVGGGPAGLYFAILMKGIDPDHEVAVYERLPAGHPGGWGVVFWDDLLGDLRATDPETARRMTDGAYRWHRQVLTLGGSVAEVKGFGYSMARSRLLEILSSRAIELGVDIRFDHDVMSAGEFVDADVAVIADGANSRLRQLDPDRFVTNIAVGANKYIWLGTTKIFNSFTFTYVNTPAGWIWSHAYAIDEHTSTFIVECTTKTWEGLGFDALAAEDGLRALAEIFVDCLEGAPLKSLGSADESLPWLNFRTVTNECWHSGNTVLMGDAAHTTHFSIGSGTRLAMQDAIALAAQLRAHDTPQSAFVAYESERRAELSRTQTDAQYSAAWFENVARYADQPPRAFLRLLLGRRDPFVHRLPPGLYYRVYDGVNRVSFLRSFRRWAMPKYRALARRKSAPPPH